MGIKVGLILVALVGMASAASVELTSDNFPSEVSGKHAFVKFFVPWCGHCKAMASAWEELGTYFKGSPALTVASVDCTQHKDLCQQQSVTGYPTLKYYTQGADKAGSKYKGARNIEAFRSFAESLVSGVDAQPTTPPPLPPPAPALPSSAKGVTAPPEEEKGACKEDQSFFEMHAGAPVVKGYIQLGKLLKSYLSY